MQETVFGLRINIRERDSLFYVADSKFSIFEQDYRMILFGNGHSDFGKPYFLSKNTGTSNTFNSYEEYMRSIDKEDYYNKSVAYKNGLYRMSGMFYKDTYAVVVTEVLKFIRSSSYLDILHGRWSEYSGVSKNNHTLKIMRDFCRMTVLLEHNLNKMFTIIDNGELTSRISGIPEDNMRSVGESIPNLDIVETTTILLSNTNFFSVISRDYESKSVFYGEKINKLDSFKSADANFSISTEVDTLGFISNSGVYATFLDNTIGFDQAFAIITINTLNTTSNLYNGFELSIN